MSHELPFRRLIHSGNGLEHKPHVRFAGSGGDVGMFGSRQIKFSDILLFLIAVLLAFIAIVILLSIFVISSHHGAVSNLVSRAETIENLARNVNDASQILRRALGDPDGETGETGDQVWKSLGGGGGKGSTWHQWIEARSPDQEAIITDNAAQQIANGIRSVVMLAKQMERSGLVQSLTAALKHTDAMLTRPELQDLIRVAAKMSHDRGVVEFVHKSVALATHFETVLLPLMETMAAEMKQASGDSREMAEAMRQMGTVAQELGEGARDVMRWYRSGGPSDAVALGSDLVRTSRELIESPAAESLVRVLEGIDWRDTGDALGAASRDMAAILADVRASGAVVNGDRMVRVLSGVLEDPGTKALLNSAPRIADNVTALLSRDNSQQLITHTSALIGRLEKMLAQAESARTVETSAEFLGVLKELMAGLINGGLHLELGDDLNNRGDAATHGRLIEPEKTRIARKTRHG